MHTCTVGIGKNGGRGGAINNSILHPIWNFSVESDAYGGPKFSSNICSSDDDEINGMGYII